MLASFPVRQEPNPGVCLGSEVELPCAGVPPCRQLNDLAVPRELGGAPVRHGMPMSAARTARSDVVGSLAGWGVRGRAAGA